MDGTKILIRREMRRRRRRLSPAVVRGAAEAALTSVVELRCYDRAATVLAYAATDGEVPAGELIGAAQTAGKRVFLPRLQDDRMEFGEYGRGWPLRLGRYGIDEPTGPVFEYPDGAAILVLAPLVAWDRRGVRLGRGGGYYDRALADLRGDACVVGLGYQFQEYATLPADPWDILLDYVITEAGTVRCGCGSRPPSNRREEEQCHGGFCMDRGYRLSCRRTRLGL